MPELKSEYSRMSPEAPMIEYFVHLPSIALAAATLRGCDPSFDMRVEYHAPNGLTMLATHQPMLPQM